VPEPFNRNAQTMYRGGAQGRGCIAAVWHMHTHASRQSLVWWGHISYCGSCTTGYQWRWIIPFSQPQYIRNCTAAIHAVCYTLTPSIRIYFCRPNWNWGWGYSTSTTCTTYTPIGRSARVHTIMLL